MHCLFPIKFSAGLIASEQYPRIGDEMPPALRRNMLCLFPIKLLGCLASQEKYPIKFYGGYELCLFPGGVTISNFFLSLGSLRSLLLASASFHTIFFYVEG